MQMLQQLHSLMIQKPLSRRAIAGDSPGFEHRKAGEAVTLLLPTVRSTGFSRNRLRVTDRIPPEGGITNKKLTASEADTILVR